jgi:hypothetical protein
LARKHLWIKRGLSREPHLGPTHHSIRLFAKDLGAPSEVVT